jgi:hypothetical protein
MENYMTLSNSPLTIHYSLFTIHLINVAVPFAKTDLPV